MLSDEQKSVLHYAIDNGFDTIECKGIVSSNWHSFKSVNVEGVLSGAMQLRIKQVPDYIDWTHVSTDIYCMARDESEKCYGYTSKIICGILNWSTNDGSNFINMSIFASYKRGTTCWKESLVLNPYYKEKR